MDSIRLLAIRPRASPAGHLLGEVAASLAHEIKQPMAAAMIDAQVYLRAFGDDRLNVQVTGDRLQDGQERDMGGGDHQAHDRVVQERHEPP